MRVSVSWNASDNLRVIQCRKKHDASLHLLVTAQLLSTLCSAANSNVIHSKCYNCSARPRWQKPQKATL